MTYRVVSLGEAMVELALSPDGTSAHVGFAGDTLNTAIYLKRLSPDLRVDYVTKIGTDPLSDRMLTMMRNENLHVDAIARDTENEPGLYAITTDEAGERSFTYWRSTSAARKMFVPPAIDLADIQGAQMFYTSAISLAILPPGGRDTLLSWVQSYRAQGGLFAFDSNFRPKLWESLAIARDTIKAFWEQTDIGLPSVDDEMAIYGDRTDDDVVARLNAWGVTAGALKRGANGPRALSGDTVPACGTVAKVVDSTAAGDSFNAGFLASYIRGDETILNLQAGHNLASQVVGFRGALLPRDHVDAL